MAKATEEHRAVATNRQARRDYEILETFEAGLVLMGSEVKSLRDGRVNVKDAYAELDGDELFLVHLHISPYEQAGPTGHQPERRRKLLMRRREIERLRGKLVERGLALIPLSIYFKNRWVKVELGLGRGKKQYDKRQDVAERESKREMQRALRREHGGGGGGGRRGGRGGRGGDLDGFLVPFLVPLLVATALGIASLAFARTVRAAPGEASSGPLPILVRWGPGMEPERVDARAAGGTLYLPVNVVARWLGAVKEWDPSSLTLTLRTSRHLIKVIAGNHWVTIDGRLVNLPDPARLEAGALDVPLALVEELAPRVLDRRLHWEPERGILTLHPGNVNILRVDFGGDEDGALEVHVELADSLGFELDASRPGEVRLRIEKGEYEAGIAEESAPVLPVRRVTSGHDGDVAEIIFEMADESGTATAVPSEGGRRIEITLGGFVPEELEPPRLDSRPFPTLPVGRDRSAGSRVVVLDPGHGGTERGAVGPSGFLEKKATLEIARYMKQELEEDGFRVMLTRTDDRLEPLARRAAMANLFGADLFVSIHCNSWPGGRAEGFEVYVARRDSRARADSSARAMDSDALRWGAAQDAFIEESRLFAGFAREELGRLGLRDRGTRSAGFAVLRGVMAPAILVETAFISNPDEEARLADPGFQQEIAGALANAVRRFAPAPAPARGRRG